MLAHTIQLTVFAIILSVSGFSVASPEESRSAIVICASKSNGPWKVIAKGFLIRTRTAERDDYLIQTPEHTFSWATLVTPDKTTATTTPGSLIHAFFPRGDESPTSPRGPVVIGDVRDKPFHQSLDASGQVFERAGSIALTVGRSCNPVGFRRGAA